MHNKKFSSNPDFQVGDNINPNIGASAQNIFSLLLLKWFSRSEDRGSGRFRFFTASIFVLFFFVFSTTYSTEPLVYKLKGTVTDEKRSPVEFVTVTILELGISTSTNSKGVYEFSDVPPGSYMLTLKRSGYESKTLEVTVTGSDVTSDASLNESLIETPVIDVTSSFSPVDISRSTYSITELNSKDITRKRSQTLAETIQNIPGVNNISTGPSLGKPVIRGLSFQSMLIVHDGVKHESQMWGAEHGPELSLFDLDRIEILRGPASLVYGPDAIGGVVNVITKPLQFSNRTKPIMYGEAVLGFFSVDNQGLGNITLGMGTSNFGVKGHFGYRESGNVKTPEGTFEVKTLDGPSASLTAIEGGKLFNSGQKELEGGASLGFNGKFGSVSLGFETMNREVQIHEDPAEDPEATPNQKLNTHQLSLEGSFNISKPLKLEPVLSYQMQERREFESKEDKDANFTALDLKINSLDGTLNLHHLLTKTISGIAGVSFGAQKNETLAEEKLIPNYDAYVYGIYLMEKFSLKKLTLSAGARFDVKNLNIKETVFEVDSLNNPTKILNPQTIDFTAVTGSFGTAYSPAQQFSIFANIGRGWRPPSEFEMFVDGIHEGTGRYNRGLRTVHPQYKPKPEESINLDFGIRLNLKILNLQLSIFRNQVNNFVYPSPTADTIEGYPVYDVKQDKSTFTGFEYSVQLQPVKWFVLAASGDYVKTENKATGNPLPFTPPMKNIFEMKLQKSDIGKFSNPYVKFGVKIVSGQNDVDPLETTTEGYTLINAGAGFDFVLAKSVASLDFSVDNLANTKYVDHLSRYRSYAMNPGRSLNVQLSVPFRF
jgi:iron complex outermembrane receptor protein